MIPWRFGKRQLTQLGEVAGTLADARLPWEIDRWIEDRDSLGLMDAGKIPAIIAPTARARRRLHSILRWLSICALIYLMLYPIDTWRHAETAQDSCGSGTVAGMGVCSLPLLAKRPLASSSAHRRSCC